MVGQVRSGNGERVFECGVVVVVGGGGGDVGCWMSVRFGRSKEGDGETGRREGRKGEGWMGVMVRVMVREGVVRWY